MQRKRLGSEIARLVNHQFNILFPLDDDTALTRWANPLGLIPNKTYIVETQTPLVPAFDPIDPLAAIDKIVQIPGGSRISVQKFRERFKEPWYRVDAISTSGRALGSG